MARRRRVGNDPGERGRFSARRKTEAVLRLLRGAGWPVQNFHRLVEIRVPWCLR